MPKFSIIIPVYNVAPYLRECLDSVLNQTFTDWEAICVDDGSTDGSGEILDEYAAKEEEKLGGGGERQIKVIHQKNQGVSAARNAALDIIAGEWVMFLDADDVWCSHLLSEVYAGITNEAGLALISFGFEEFVDKISFVECATKSSFVCIERSLDEQELLKFFWTFAYRKDIIQNLRFAPYTRGEDRLFLAEVLLNRVNKYKVLPNRLYGYRQRASSAMHCGDVSLSVMKDRFGHRIDILRLIVSSRKKVNYAGGMWLERYFLTRAIEEILSNQKDDINTLYHAWRDAICILVKTDGLNFSWGSSILFWLGSKVNCVLAMCFIYHIAYWRDRLYNIHSAVCRQFRLGRLK